MILRVSECYARGRAGRAPRPQKSCLPAGAASKVRKGSPGPGPGNAAKTISSRGVCSLCLGCCLGFRIRRVFSNGPWSTRTFRARHRTRTVRYAFLGCRQRTWPTRGNWPRPCRYPARIDRRTVRLPNRVGREKPRSSQANAWATARKRAANHRRQHERDASGRAARKANHELLGLRRRDAEACDELLGLRRRDAEAGDERLGLRRRPSKTCHRRFAMDHCPSTNRYRSSRQCPSTTIPQS